MAGSKDDLKDRHTHYREIKIASSAGSLGTQSRFPSGSCWKATSSTSYPCRARTPSGIGTYSKTRRFGLMRGELEGSFERHS